MIVLLKAICHCVTCVQKAVFFPPLVLCSVARKEEIIFVFSFVTPRKKSVDDLLTSSQDVINQAISLTTSSANRDTKAKRSPSPKKSHKRDKSDVSTFSSDFVEVVSVCHYVTWARKGLISLSIIEVNSQSATKR